MSNPDMIFTIQYKRTSRGVATVRAGSIDDAMARLVHGSHGLIEDEERALSFERLEFDVRPLTRRERFDMIVPIYEIRNPELWINDDTFNNRFMLIEETDQNGMCWSVHPSLDDAAIAVDLGEQTICCVDLDTGDIYAANTIITTTWEKQ